MAIVQPSGSAALPVLADTTLGADSATLDLNPPFAFGTYPVVTYTARVKLTGVHSPHYGHLFVRFNGDTTVNGYAGSVRNSDNTGLVSVPGNTYPTTSCTDAILVGHAPTTDADAATEWGIVRLEIYFPGAGSSVKNVHVANTIMTSFTGYGDLNPIEMRGGGFWAGPGPITRITLLPEFNLIAAGSRALVVGGVG